MDKEEITIQEVIEFTPEVAATIRHLVTQLDDGFSPLSDDDVREMIDAPSTHLFVAKLREGPFTIVGMFTLIYYRIPYKRKGWIEDVVVDLPYRKRGIAHAMMNFAIEEAKRLEIKSLNLTSSPERNTGKFYEDLGFEKRNTNVYRINL